MPFKSEKQRKWMHANKPKMAKKWEKEEKSVEEDRDYKAEYKKFQSSTKAKKYRAELNQYNRKKGTYGNGDGKDASHKGGKIAGFEAESTNRGRAEKSRLKKEGITMLEAKFTDDTLASRIKHWSKQHKGTGIGYGHVLGQLAVHMKEMGWDKSFKEVARIAVELGKKKKVESVGEGFGGELKGKDKQKFEKARKESAEQLGYKLTGITDIKEAMLNENPAAAAAAAMAAVQVMNAKGNKIKGTSALQSSDPRVQKKAKGIFKRLKDKFAKGKGKRDFEKQKKAVSKGADDYIRKLDKESVNEGTKAFLAYRKMKEGIEEAMKSIRIFRKFIDDAPYNPKFAMITKELYKWEIDLEKKYRRVVPQISNISKDKMLESVDEGKGNEQSIDGEQLMNFLMKRFKYSKKQAIASMKKHKMDLSFLKKESVNEGFTKYHIRLTKTPGWYGVWDKNGKQKFEGDRKFVTKHLKKLKTRMGNVQLKSLIDVATKRKGKDITFDVVESVNERMDKRQSAETLKQLGGNKFIAMTGAKNFGFGSKGMVFKIGRNSKGVNYVRIDLRNDLYNMEFIQMRAGKEKIKSKIKGVYNDQLQKIFTKHTGMYTRL